MIKKTFSMCLVIVACSAPCLAATGDAVFPSPPEAEFPDPADYGVGTAFSLASFFTPFRVAVETFCGATAIYLDSLDAWSLAVDDLLSAHDARLAAIEATEIVDFSAEINTLRVAINSALVAINNVRVWAGITFDGHMARIGELNASQSVQDNKIREAEVEILLLYHELDMKMDITGMGAYSLTTHTHEGLYQPVGDYLVEADLAHDHDDLYQPLGDYLTADDLLPYALKTNHYTKAESDTNYISQVVYYAHMWMYHYGVLPSIPITPPSDFDME